MIKVEIKEETAESQKLMLAILDFLHRSGEKAELMHTEGYDIPRNFLWSLFFAGVLFGGMIASLIFIVYS